MNNKIDKLYEIANSLAIDKYRIKPVLDNAHFCEWSGSAKSAHHHYGNGGLLAHTLEVVELTLKICDYYQGKVDQRLAYLAALYHDFGKIFDYKCVDGTWTSSEHKYTIHHISRSFARWEYVVEDYFNNKHDNEVIWFKPLYSYCQEVSHAILSHHGHREYGSPVEPRTKLAFILHYCDAISARVDDCNKLFKA